ncbi:MAG TPA: winged helix-turn-helix domain-containing protein [Acidobacteriota bacterium]|nr:winged helix-turn-helix domain-containing protein [Acidobacteriota bacterium]
MSAESGRYYEFGPFRIDAEKRLLLENGNPVPLAPKAFDLLLLLVRKRGELVEKDELLEKVWPNTFVEEANLSVNVSALRKILGEKASDHLYIVTVPGRGYRFVAEARVLPDNGMGREASALSTGVTEGKIAAPLQGKDDLVNPPPSPEPALLAPGWRRTLSIVLTLLGLVAAALYPWIRSTRYARRPADNTIAILPFKVLSPDAGDEFLGLALADVLIARLSSVRQITIRPATAVRAYLSLEKDPAAIAEELRVGSVVEGTIQKIGNRIRFTVRLLRMRDSEVLWAGKFDETLTDLFAVEDSISEQVASALTPKISPEEQDRLRKRHTSSPDAYMACLKGRYFLNKRTEEGILKGIDCFQQAIGSDPNYALAYAGLADCYAIQGVYEELPPKLTFPKAKESAMRALDIDENLAEAHTSLAFARQHYDWDWPGAEREYRKAIGLDPNSAQTRHWYAVFLDAERRPGEALAEIRKAQELDPLSLVINADTALIYYHSRDFENAIRQCRRTLELDANFARAHWYLGLAYFEEGLLREAMREFQKGIELSQGSAVMLGWQGYACALSGNRSEAVGVLEKLGELAKHEYVTPYARALVYIGLSDKDQAFAWLQRAYEDRSDVLAWLRVEPGLDGLRSDQRFAELERKVALGTYDK